MGQINTAWLEQVLIGAGFGALAVTGFTTQRVGTGQAAICCRIFPDYAEPRPHLPKSIIAKFSAEDAATREAGAKSKTYLREVNYYRRLQSGLSIRTPRCFLAEIEDAGPDFALLLEDLSPAEQGDQIAGCSPELARVATLELVGLHAPSWGNQAMLGFDWANGTNSPGRSRTIMDVYRRGLPQFMQRCADGLSAQEAAFLQRIAKPEDYPSEYPMIKSHCLTHNDYRVDNFLIDDRTDPVVMHVVDWQTLGVGNPMRDLAYFIGGCVLPDQRIKIEKNLVREYHERMLASGVRDYNWDDCWSDYRRASFHGIMTAMAGMIYVTRTERGDQLFSIMAQRHLKQALELEAEEFLQ